MMATKTTKKVRASRVTVGMSINGQSITQVIAKDHYGAPGTMPWTMVEFYAGATILLGTASTEWVEVDR